MTEADFENVFNLLNGKKGATIIGGTQIEIDELQEIINEVKRRKSEKQDSIPVGTPID